tara:strand:- start:821 stop:1327 length:507 start_codon:yes stop_codon:yes gene_type:complete
MMPQPPQQRPARMPSGPSPTMGGGMPNRPDQLRQQAERTLPSMPPMGGGRPPMGGGAPAGGIAALMGGGPKPPMGGAPRPSAPPPMGGGMPPMGNEPMAEDGPGEQDLVVGIAMTANEIAGGEPRRAIAMLDQAKDLLMQQVGSEDGEGAGEPDMGRLAEILGGEMMA